MAKIISQIFLSFERKSVILCRNVKESSLFNRLKPMKKQKIHIEKELKCKSSNIIWPLLSTPEGLMKWIADDVKRDGDQLTFRWGELWTRHEIRTAEVREEVKGERIRFVWDDDDDKEAFWELGLEWSDITGDFILLITDFAYDEDLDSLSDIWDQNLEQLHMNTGL